MQVLVELVVTILFAYEVFVQLVIINSKLLLGRCLHFIITIIKYSIRMASKRRIVNNPFGPLEEEEEEPMSTPTANTSRNLPVPSVTHRPLPFNPYQISKEQKKVEPKKIQPQPLVPVTKNKQPANFASPFSEPQIQRPTYSDQQNQSQYSQSQRSEQLPPPELDENGDPPLLYDIGIQPEKIKQRIILVLKLSQPTYQVIHDPDLSGPIAIALTLGILLLLAGKIHFGDIYAMFVFGNCLLYCLLNFMSQAENIPFYNIMSILGYGLLPMLLLGLIGVFFALNKGIGTILAILIASWASYAAGNFMNVLMRESKDRKLLIMYPLFLYYLSFTLIVIF